MEKKYLIFSKYYSNYFSYIFEVSNQRWGKHFRQQGLVV